MTEEELAADERELDRQARLEGLGVVLEPTTDNPRRWRIWWRDQLGSWSTEADWDQLESKLTEISMRPPLPTDVCGWCGRRVPS